ncbi:MAG: acylneuraminate cytidylyltransferase family protein [Candidatus Wildermuthbacteria bacterium]|nr:acylneuraminate cytidylyltransferase family protein [Candidatus Wildermuthbacteria bacterium]
MEYSKNKIVAFIPIRGGSKSIPLKNIKELAGKPLAFWVIQAALNCSLVDEVVVSTDSDAIKNKVGELKDGKLRIIGRSKETATDTASTESAMLEFARADDSFKHIILIQATSPLLESSHLEAGIKKYFENKYGGLLSVVRQKRFIWEEKGGKANPVNYNPLKRPRRQEWDGFLVENGAFYITSRENLLQTNCRLSGEMGVYEMPEETYFELDEPSDWIIIEEFLKKRK